MFNNLQKLRGCIPCFLILFGSIFNLELTAHSAFNSDSELIASDTTVCPDDIINLSFTLDPDNVLFYWGFSMDGGINYNIIDSTFQNPIAFTVTENTLVRLDLRDEFDISTFLFLEIICINPQPFLCPSSQDLIFDSNCEVLIPDFLSLQNIDVQQNTTGFIQSPSPGISGSLSYCEIHHTGLCLPTATCDIAINTIDNLASEILCEGDIEVTLPDDASTITLQLNIPSIYDECSLYTLKNDIGGSETEIDFGIGITEVIWTAIDAFGNESSCSVMVEVLDITPPIFTYCPDSLVFYSYNTGCEGEIDFTPVVTDNVGIVSFYNNLGYWPGQSIELTTGNYDLIWTAIDTEGLVSTCETNVILTDSIVPQITCPNDITIGLSASECSIDFTIPSDAALSDNCGWEDTWTIPSEPIVNLLSGTYSIEYFIKDFFNNEASCKTIVTVVDIEDPIIVCPTEIVISSSQLFCDSLIDLLFPGVSDNCEVNSTWNNVTPMNISLPAELAQGTYQITWFAQDISGNQTFCSSNLIVKDEVGPTLNCPLEYNLQINSSCEIIVPDFSTIAIASDACSGILSWSQSPIAGTILSDTTTITITATDTWGNVTTCLFDLNPTDNIQPTIENCPDDQVVYLDENCSYSLSDWTLGLTVSDQCAQGFEIIQFPEVGELYTIPDDYNVALYVTDQFGLSSSCFFKLSVVDSIRPSVVQSIPDSIIYLDQNCIGVIPDFSNAILFTDNCSSTIDILQTPVAGTLINTPGEIEVSIEGTDASGNSRTFTVTVSVTDTIAPIFTQVISEVILNLDNNCQVTIPDFTSQFQATDACSQSVTLSQNRVAGSIYTPSGSFDITVFAADDSGNVSSQIVTFQPLDIISPQVFCEPTIEHILPADLCEELISIDLPSATDNCGIPTVESNYGSLQAELLAGPGQYEIIWTATDSNGNFSTCITELIVIDETGPFIDCPANVIFCEETISIPSFTATDACGVLSIDVSNTDLISSGVFPIGTTQIEATAIDLYGNITECSFTVTRLTPNDCCVGTAIAGYISYTPQVAYCYGDIIELSIENYAGTPGWQYSTDNGSTWIASDDLSPENISIELLDSILIQTWSALEYCDTAFSNIIEFIPFSLALATCPAPETIYIENNCDIPTPDYTSAWSLFYDNPDVVVVQNPIASTSLGLGNHVVQITASSYCHYYHECNFEIVVADTLAPVFESGWPPYLNLVLGDNCNMAIPADILTLVAVSDNCTADQSIELNTGEIVYGETDILIQIIAYDESGNSSELEIALLYSDQTAPSIICPDTLTYQVMDGCKAHVPDFSNLVILSDNCGISNFTQDMSIDDAIGLGIFEIDLGVMDPSGNSNSCIAVIHVIDTISPEVICPPDFNLYLDENCSAVVPDLTFGLNITEQCDYTIQQFPEADALISYSSAAYVYITDISGNERICQLQLNVLDTLVGALICPGDTTLYITSYSCEIPFDYSIVFNDNCNNGEYELIEGYASGMPFPIGQATVSFSALENGLTLHTCSFAVTVLDTIAPVLAESITMETCDPFFNFNEPEATDNCSYIVSRIDNNGFEIGEALPEGTTEFVYIATDPSGNTDTTSIIYFVPVPAMLEFTSDTLEMCNSEQTIVLYDYVNSTSLWTTTTSGYENGVFVPSDHNEGEYWLEIASIGEYCPLQDSILLVVHDNGNITYSGITSFCGLTASLNLEGNCDIVGIEVFPDGMWEMDNLNSVLNIEVPEIGDYMIELSGITEYGCETNIEIELSFAIASSSISAGTDITLVNAGIIIITGMYEGIGVPEWNLVSGDAQIISSQNQSVNVALEFTGNSLLSFSIDHGLCGVFSDTMQINLITLELPNTISPNGDDVNDQFAVPGLGINPIEIVIVDRWGYEVFRSGNYQNDWPTLDPSQPAPLGDVYYYEIKMNSLKYNGFIMIKND